jgi:hypothetical protein
MGIDTYLWLESDSSLQFLDKRENRRFKRWQQRWTNGVGFSCASMLALVLRERGIPSECLHGLEEFTSTLSVEEVTRLIAYLRRLLRDTTRGGIMAEADLAVVRPFGYTFPTAEHTVRTLLLMLGTARPIMRMPGVRLCVLMV